MYFKSAPTWTSNLSILAADVKVTSDKPHDFVGLKVHEFKSPYVDDLNKEFGVTLKFAMVFECKPYSRGLIHADLDDYALNIPLGEPSGHQVWVTVPVEPTLSYYGETAKKPFKLFPDNVPREEKARLFLDKPYWVNTGFLHYVENDSPLTRRVLTLRFNGPSPI